MSTAYPTETPKPTPSMSSPVNCERSVLARAEQARAHASPLAHPNRQPATLTSDQRPHRSGQQPREAHQAGLVRGHQPRPLPHQSLAIRRQARLDSPRRHHSTLEREESYMHEASPVSTTRGQWWASLMQTWVDYLSTSSTPDRGRLLDGTHGNRPNLTKNAIVACTP